MPEGGQGPFSLPSTLNIRLGFYAFRSRSPPKASPDSMLAVLRCLDFRKEGSVSCSIRSPIPGGVCPKRSYSRSRMASRRVRSWP